MPPSASATNSPTVSRDAPPVRSQGGPCAPRWPGAGRPGLLPGRLAEDVAGRVDGCIRLPIPSRIWRHHGGDTRLMVGHRGLGPQAWPGNPALLLYRSCQHCLRTAVNPALFVIPAKAGIVIRARGTNLSSESPIHCRTIAKSTTDTKAASPCILQYWTWQTE